MTSARRCERPLTVWLAGALLLVAACAGGDGGDGAAPGSELPAGEPLVVVQGAMGRLRARPVSTVTVVATVRSPATGSERDLELDGLFSGDGGDRAHLVHRGADSGGADTERFLSGTDLIATTTIPDVDRRWIGFDGTALDEAFGGPHRSSATNDQILALFVASREPSPLSALRLLDRADEAVTIGPEDVDGRSQQRFDVVTPPAAAVDAYGGSVAGNAVIECREGVTTSVWIDDTGDLVAIRYRLDHLALGTTATITFAPADDQHLPDPPEDSDIFDMTAQLNAGPSSGGSSDSVLPPVPVGPCAVVPDADAAAAGLDRAACPSDAMLDPHWNQLAERTRLDPLSEGWAWLSFVDPAPIADAIAVAPDVQVAGFFAVYPGPLGSTVKAGFVNADSSSIEVVLGQIRRGSTGDAADPRLAAIVVTGTWSALASEASDCGYHAPELAPWGRPLLSNVD